MTLPKLLLIDDEEINVKVLSISLRTDGYEVATAYSGEEGLAVYQKEKPDIVLTDIKMPGMDGLEVLRRLKEEYPDVEVIIITGHGDIDAAIEALQYGASDFVNKPIRDDVLALALQRAQEKLRMKRQLQEYTDDLENMVQIATEEFKRKSNFQQKLITSSNDGIIATDDEFNIVIYNPGAESIFGFTPVQVIGKLKVSDLYPPDLAVAFQGKDAGLSAAKKVPWQEIAIRTKDGTSIPARCSGTLLSEKGKLMGSVAFFQDLREIKRLEAELVHSERLAAIGQTVAGMAHGIKNILHGFKGGSYLVNVGIDKNDDDKVKSGWTMIQKNIDRTSKLILDLLSFSKDREPEYEICSPNEIVEDVCDVLKETAEENEILIVKELSNSIGEVSLDPNTAHAAILNLTSNAIDACIFDEHTKSEYRVTVRTTLEEDNVVCIQIEDNGSGMREEVLDKLFTSFFSTKGVKGTGLGLLVTKKLVEEHGGTIDVSSQWGRGTAFTMRLPVKPIAEDA